MVLDPSLIRPLKREEYDHLVALGAFENERVELLHGMVVRMSPHGPRHDDAIQRVTRLLVKAVDPRAQVRVQSAFATPGGSEPEPDLALVAPGSYAKAHPSRALLIIELADSSLATDRNVKAAIYAVSGVPEYWIVNLVDHVIEVSTDPSGDAYAKTTIYRRGAQITLTQFPDVTIPVTEVLP